MTLHHSKSRRFSHCSNMTLRGCRAFIQISACLALITIVVADKENCNPTKCPGPLAYYKSLKCIPVYKNEGDCCATKFTCDHLKERSPTKCYVNDNAYEIGEKLKDEDATPCDTGCNCTAGRGGIAAFRCLSEGCISRPAQPGCYKKHSPLRCCDLEEVCPENPEDRAICNVDGKIYRDGEFFAVEGEPDLRCVCQPGYKGNNVEPFCAKLKRDTCTPEFKYAFHLFNNCAPIYDSSQSPQTDCSYSTRCQNGNDTVIHNEQDNSKSTEKNSNDEDVCYFGNMTMHRGDELNQNTDYSSVCVKCICEVPPVPTCQRIPYEECNYARHHLFHPQRFHGIRVSPWGSITLY
ncbi:uncharacterized protein LOC105201361 [Solenopsis invicta]|uniref:uncharacterized protein LOC105201361 n=1 Tax=Solenopsis invicta TaxID=13686 RepID=UPI00193E0721|nr:uncharacterized protein LOC105201361 [Solenopsis invicta]